MSECMNNGNLKNPIHSTNVKRVVGMIHVSEQFDSQLPKNLRNFIALLRRSK